MNRKGCIILSIHPEHRGFDPPSGRQHSFVEVMEYFLRSFSPFRWFKKCSCQFLVKENAQYLVDRLEDEACLVKVWLGNLTALNMTPQGWLGRKTANKQTIRTN